MILHGKDLIVSIDGNSMLASKSCTLTVSAKSITKTSPTSGDWEEVLSGKKSWSLSTNHLVKPATGVTPEHIFNHAEVEISNSTIDGWRAIGNGESGMSVYVFDETGVAEGIHLMEISNAGQYIRTTVFDKDGKYGGTADALKNYLNGGAIDGHTIGSTSVIMIMTVGEFRMDYTICGILSDTYHVALPVVEFGKSPSYGSPSYDTAPVIIVGGKGLSYGFYAGESISNEVLFNLRNGNVPQQKDGIPGAIDMVGKMVSISMTDSNGSRWTGQAEITQFKVIGTKGSLMTGAFSFKGNGQLQTDSQYDYVVEKPKTYVNRIFIDMNVKNPAEMITGDVNGDIFQEIMSRAHRYLGKYQGSGEMALCQLADDDGTRFYTGDYATLDGTQGDVFMGFRRRLFYHIIYVGNKKYIFEVANVYMGGNWKIWEPHYLIGAFRVQSTTSYDNNVESQDINTGYLRSIAADRPAFTDTYDNILFQMEGRNPNYFGIVGPEEHALIALLFFMKYGTTNSQAMCGKGSISDSNTGASARLGMKDTDAATGLNFINIFGLEDWWSGTEAEAMERIRYNSGKIYVTPWGGSEGAGTDISIGSSKSEAVISNMLFSDTPLKMVPEGLQPYSENWETYFCDGVKIIGQSQVVTRGKGDTGGDRGICAMKLGRSQDDAGDVDTTRLCFRGASATEYSDITSFLNLRAEDPLN